jgi:hypothetical protein
MLGVAELGGGETVAAHPDEAEVGEAVGPGHVEGQLTTVAEGRHPGGGLAENVGGGEDEAVGVITTPEPAPPASRPRPPRPMTRSCTTEGSNRSATDVTTVE